MNCLSILNIASHKMGGFERWLVTFTEHLHSLGHQHVICFEGEPSELVRNKLEDAGAVIIIRSFNGSKRKQVADAFSLVNLYDIKIVHMHFYNQILSMLSLLMGVLPVKYYVTYHISGAPANSNKVVVALKKLRYLAFGLSIDKVICVSRFNQKKLVNDYQIPEVKTQVIYNGLDPSSFFDLPKTETSQNKVRITSVAFLIEDKGLQHLIHAMPKVVEHNSNVELCIVGDGPYSDQLKKQAQFLGLSDHVHFLGRRDDVPEIMVNSDIGVVPSIWEEAFGYTVIEVMAAKIPVVASRIGGIPEIVEDGVSGYLVDPGQSDQISEKLIQLIDDESLRNRMGEASVERVKTLFSQEASVNQISELYFSDEDTSKVSSSSAV